MSRTPSRGLALLEGLSELRPQLADRGPDWARRRRELGWNRFTELGLPSAKQEEWRNTNVAPIGGTRFDPARPASGEPRLEGPAALELGGARLLFVNGHAVPALSHGLSDNGVWVGTLADALEQIPDRLQPWLAPAEAGAPAAFEALNDAFLHDGAVVLVPDGVHVEAPIHVIYASGAAEPTVNQPRTLVVAGKGSQATVVEVFTGEGTYLTNGVSETIVGDNARVEHYRLQLDSEAAYHISTIKSRQGRDSRFVAHHLDLGGRLVRHDVRATLDGEGGDCQINGLYLPHGEQHMDNHTVLDHAKPHCDSREVYKGVLNDRARSIFSGRIIVREDAQKTDAKQSNPNLLLSPTALAHTRPQLEIYADDVKCTHGATVGRLDAEAIFYLRARGVPESLARRMLIEAFAGEVLDRMQLDGLREEVSRLVVARLDGRQ